MVRGGKIYMAGSIEFSVSSQKANVTWVGTGRRGAMLLKIDRNIKSDSSGPNERRNLLVGINI
jgi:hypothetical protein